jgi:hypothetical protein
MTKTNGEVRRGFSHIARTIRALLVKIEGQRRSRLFSTAH